MKKFTLRLKMCLFLSICLIFTAFIHILPIDEQTSYVQKILSSHYDDGPEPRPVKRYELNVTNSGFCRYKRYFVNGKVEYFSFNLTKFKDLDYYGNDKNGKLFLRTNGDDVIVQTYNDEKEGDIDSMATYMIIPFKGIEPQDLTDLYERLVRLNAQLLAQK